MNKELNLKKKIKSYEGLKESCTNKTGAYQPHVERTKLQFNRRKLRTEERVINLTLIEGCWSKTQNGSRICI